MKTRASQLVFLLCSCRNFTVKMRHEYKQSLHLVLSCLVLHQQHSFCLPDCSWNLPTSKTEDGFPSIMTARINCTLLLIGYYNIQWQLSFCAVSYRPICLRILLEALNSGVLLLRFPPILEIINYLINYFIYSYLCFGLLSDIINRRKQVQVHLSDVCR